MRSNLTLLCTISLSCLGGLNDLFRRINNDNKYGLEELTARKGFIKTDETLQTLVANSFGTDKLEYRRNIRLLYIVGTLLILIYWIVTTEFFLLSYLIDKDTFGFNMSYVEGLFRNVTPDDYFYQSTALNVTELNSILYYITLTAVGMTIVGYYAVLYITILAFRFSVIAAGSELGLVAKVILAFLIHFFHITTMLVFLYGAYQTAIFILKDDTYSQFSLRYEKNTGIPYVDYDEGIAINIAGNLYLDITTQISTSFPLYYPYGMTTQSIDEYVKNYAVRKEGNAPGLYDRFGSFVGFSYRIADRNFQANDTEVNDNVKRWTRTNSATANTALINYCETILSEQDTEICALNLLEAIDRYRSTSFFLKEELARIKNIIFEALNIASNSFCMTNTNPFKDFIQSSELMLEDSDKIKMNDLVNANISMVSLISTPLILTYAFNLFVILFVLISLVFINYIRLYSLQSETAYYEFTKRSTLVLSSSFVLTITLISSFLFLSC